MTSKRLLEQPRAGDSTHEGGCAGQREPVIGKALHDGALRNFGKEISPNGHYNTSTRERHYIHKKVSDMLTQVLHSFTLVIRQFINESERLSAVMVQLYDGSSDFRLKLTFACSLMYSLQLYCRR